MLLHLPTVCVCGGLSLNRRYQMILCLQLHWLRCECAGIIKARILKIITCLLQVPFVRDVFPGLQEVEFNRWSRDYSLLRFYPASCCQYIFVLQVQSAAIAKTWRALWSVWHFSLYLVFCGASTWVYDLVLFQESTAAGLIKNGNAVGDVAHNRFETNALSIVLQPAVSAWVRSAFPCSWLD